MADECIAVSSLLPVGHIIMQVSIYPIYSRLNAQCIDEISLTLDLLYDFVEHLSLKR